MTFTILAAPIATSNNTLEAATLADGRIVATIQGGFTQIPTATGTLIGTVDPHPKTFQ